MKLYLLDPAPTPAWRPFQDSRPVSELRAGAWLIRERWEAISGAETAAIFGPAHLHAFVEPGCPAVTGRTEVAGPAWVGRSDFAPAGIPPEIDESASVCLTHEGTTVGWWIADGATWDAEATLPTVELDGLLLKGSWDLLTALEHFLHADCADFVAEGGDPIPDHVTVLGEMPEELVILGAMVEPGVVFDVRSGAIVLEQGAYVRAGTRLQGPCYVGPGTHILGGPVSGSAFGPQCRVRGEVSAAVFLGYANKAHDGFVGHTVVGRWANLGAGTTTSNLKNTYGDVRLDLGGTPAETGRQFVGTLMGDHVKTAIGTMLGTGTVLGVGANVFGAVRPPKYVRPFAWGDADRMRRDGFLEIAERVMPRRDVKVDDAVKAMLGAIYDHASSG